MYNKNDIEIDNTDWLTYSMHEFKLLRHLTILFQENNTIDLIDQIDLDKILEDINKSTLNPILLFKRPPTKFPSAKLNPNIAIFLKLINDICKLLLKKRSPQNLTADENQVLDDLCKNKLIVIKASDKGGNVVVMENYHYRAMCQKILDNRSWYKSISARQIQ